MGPGTVLGSRYVLRRRLDDDGDQSTWQAHDQTLERRVRLSVVVRGHEAAQAVLDAARRAAGVEDPRLVRILDVGEDDGRTFIVSEWLDGQDLAELVSSGPMAGEEARTVLGEVSLALEAARHRGLHHLRLRPALIHRTEDGSVKVEGLATAAALAQLDVEDSDEACRQDTHDLVAVGYAALTGMWPMDDDSVDLPAAPRVAGFAVAPSEVVSAVPADLDTLCAQTFAGPGAPATPGDLARQIAPWGRERRGNREDGVFPHALPPVRLPRPGTGSGAATSPDAKRPPQPESHQPPESKPAPELEEPVVESEPVVPRVRPARTGATPSGRAAVQPSTPASSRPPKAAPPSPPTAPPTAAPVGPTPAARRGRDPGTRTTPVVHQPTTPLPAVRPAPAPVARPATTETGAAPAQPQRAARVDTGDHPLFGVLLGPADDDRYSVADGAYAPVERSPRQTRMVIAIMIAFVAVFLLLAFIGLRGLGGDAFLPAAGPTTSPSSTNAEPSTPTDAPSPTSTTTARQVVRITSASGFDPEGDGSEKDELAGQAFDGDPTTAWTSDRYRSPEFGGLKDGVGLRLDLAGRPTVTDVKVTLEGSGATVQLRTAAGDDLGLVLAQERDASGTVTLTPKEPVRASDLVLWFTTPADEGDGYRVGVAEVRLS